MRSRAVAIYGLGLIGGSLGLAIRARASGVRVYGREIDPDAARAALGRGAVDTLLEDPVPLPADVGIVFTAVPPHAAVRLIPIVARALPAGAVLCDLSSVMEATAGAASEAGLSGRFVNAHPMRGSEQAGIAAASGDLYEGGMVLIAAAPEAAEAADRVAGLWTSIGARVVYLTPSEHDALVAWTSHLPLLAAAALVRVLRGSGEGPASLARAAGPGVADATRIAASPPSLWAEILEANRANLLPALALWEKEARGAREAVESGGAALLEWLEQARAFRRELLP